MKFVNYLRYLPKVDRLRLPSLVFHFFTRSSLVCLLSWVVDGRVRVRVRLKVRDLRVRVRVC